MAPKTPPFENTGADRSPAEPDAQFSMCFTSTPRGARLARRLASHRLDAWGFPYGSEVNDNVALVVAELAANAVTHGRVPGRDFRLDLAHVAARELVVVAVTDTRDAALPLDDKSSAPADPSAEVGRGLRLVAHLASRLSVEPRREGGPGKTVRAELGLRDGPCATTEAARS
jgi:anti-sigma regulatory factor (Ser/Thr protein kinase)